MPHCDNLQFVGSVDLQAAVGKHKRPSFEIAAYSGGALDVGFGHPVVVELSGVEKNPRIPALLDHDHSKIVGQIQNVDIRPDGIFVSGVFTGTEDGDAKRVIAHAKDGFEWQASIGARIASRRFIPKGETETINGKRIAGPAIVASRSNLYEVSFVSVGADSSTSAAIAAAKGNSMPENQTIETETDTLTAELDRVKGITVLAMKYHDAEGRDEIIQAAIDGDDDPRKVELKLLRASTPVATAPAFHRGSNVNQSSVLEAGMLMRAGHGSFAEKEFDPATLEAAHRVRNLSMVDIARRCALADGHSIEGESHDRVIKAAFSSLSLPTLLNNVANKSLMSAYSESKPTWQEFAAERNVSDFKEATSIRPSWVSSFSEVAPDGQLKHGTLDEDSITYSARTFGEMISITRRDIVNDSLGAFEQALPALARAANRALSDAVWTEILTDSTYFTSAHGNLGEAASALSVSTLSDAIVAINTQRDDQGNDLDLTPQVLVVSPELRTTAEGILNSLELSQSVDGTPTGNPLRSRLRLAVEPRISNTGKFSSASTTQWFLFAGPSDVPFVVAFLDGRKVPTTEMQDAAFSQLGVQMRVFWDYGVAMGDYRTGYKATGAAS